MAEIVEEFVAQTFPFVRSGHESGYVEQLNGDTSSAVDAGAVVGFASIGDAVAGACAVYLKVADCALGIDGCESG